ncbi:hypothetical protein VTJ49DRAFT_4499 [Mycothermus thermophilus]|uniref:ELYS-like domain-containing protein n=1 Tax=Humicola insolens TaxID=85995 RepID=A0ABR3V584_HUMIN
MLDFSHFAAVFPTDGPKPYDSAGVREIEALRKSFDGILFIDRVLGALGLEQPDASSSDPRPYPPRGDSGLRALHQQIYSAKVSAHAKLSVLYYLLLDHDHVRSARSTLADTLADDAGLPSNYQILMRGLWHMDRREFQLALEHLAHPSLPAEFADDVLAVLVRHASNNNNNDTTTNPNSTSDQQQHQQKDYTLALAYYHTIRPVLRSPETLTLLFTALARTSVPEALRFIRTFSPEHARRALFERLISVAIEDEDPRAVESRARSRGKQLSSLPLTPDEDRWLAEYVSVGEGRKSQRARTLVQIRRLVTGQ